MVSRNCSAPYNHTNIRNDDRIFPCCRYKNPIATFNGNVDDILFTREYNEFRENLGPGCQKCWDEEDAGEKSLRQEFNEQYDCKEVALRHLEIGFDNICNLKCDPCWDEWSYQFGEYRTVSPLENIPNTIEKITFLGGEPLMTNRHFLFLKQIGRTDIEVEYVTNATHRPKDQWVELWNKLDKVSFLVSIDGYGNLNEHVRSPSKWKDVEANVAFLEERYDITINTVVHKNNIHGLLPLKIWVGNRKWNVNKLTYPEEMKCEEGQLSRVMSQL